MLKLKQRLQQQLIDWIISRHDGELEEEVLQWHGYAIIDMNVDQALTLRN